MPATWTSGSSGAGPILAERVRTFRSDKIWMVEPYNNQLMALLTRVSETPVPNYKFEWLEKDRASVRTEVNGAQNWSANAVGSTVNLVVDSSAPFQVHAAVLNVTGGGTSGNWVAVVTAVPDSTHITLELVGKTSGGAIPATGIADNDEILLVGGNFQEFSDAPAPRHLQPSNKYNYIAHDRQTWAVSDYGESLDVYGDPELSELAADSIGHHTSIVERGIWFQVRRDTPKTGSDGMNTYFQGGVNYWIQTNVVAGGAASAYQWGDLVDDTADVYAKSVGKVKLAFAGSTFITRLGNPSFMGPGGGGSPYTNVINNRDLLSEILGFEIKQINLPHGILRVIPHYEAFVNRVSPTTATLDKMLFVLDMDNIRLMTLAGKGIGMIEQNIQNPGQHGRKDGVYSYYGLEFKKELDSGQIVLT